MSAETDPVIGSRETAPVIDETKEKKEIDPERKSETVTVTVTEEETKTVTIVVNETEWRSTEILRASDWTTIDNLSIMEPLHPQTLMPAMEEAVLMLANIKLLMP
jgi:hypothetical protein